MRNQKDIALTINNLTVGYGSGSKTKVVLEGLDLGAHKGELICLMGQNGQGKSTLLRTLSGVQNPLIGEVIIGNENLENLDLETISRKISLVLTEKPTTGNLNVLELITMGRYPYLGWNMKLSPIDKELIDYAIDRINIGELLDNKLFTLSDGQLQKVMIARALAQNGEILLLDEPTAHLDLNNRVEIMYLLKSLAKTTNKCIIMATHELDLALQMADRLWLVNNEGKIDVGVPEDLVLNGHLDAVFGHKGYNLKTGRVEHETKGRSIHLIGEGYAYLWTKNALERNGYVIEKMAELQISVLHFDNEFQWTISNSEKVTKLNSLEELLNYI